MNAEKMCWAKNSSVLAVELKERNPSKDLACWPSSGCVCGARGEVGLVRGGSHIRGSLERGFSFSILRV